MLKTALIHVAEIVQAAMVMSQTVQVGKVETGNPGPSKHGEVRVVRQSLINFRRQRSGNGIWRGPGKSPNQCSILIARLKHDCRATVAARIKIENERDVFRPRVFVDKGLRAEQAGLFSVSEEKNEIVF